MLTQEVKSGDVIDLTVSMQAPQIPGVYQSNWMLSSAEGKLFGIGRNGDAPFWVKIEVVPAGTVTQTPTPTPTLTPTAEGYLAGDVDLEDGDKFDLDNGILNPDIETRRRIAPNPSATHPECYEWNTVVGVWRESASDGRLFSGNPVGQCHQLHRGSCWDLYLLSDLKCSTGEIIDRWI